MSDLYAVFGNPIGHSKSPKIHRLFAEQTGQALDYQARLVDVASGSFTQALREFRAEGGCGANVTVPFKQQAWVAADRLSVRAERAGAVNTLHWRTDGLYGENTDGIGLVRDLQHNHGIQLAGRRILLAGAGGAAHLPGMCAAKTDLPVLGVPVKSSILNGVLD